MLFKGKECEFSVYGQDFPEMHARLRGSNKLLTRYQIQNVHVEADFPSWVDEIAEPRPDMNIKVTAFTVTQKLYNTNCSFLHLLIDNPAKAFFLSNAKKENVSQ